MEQRRELEAILQGKKGGPMGALAGLITQWLPTQTTQIAVREENGTTRATVGSIGQIQSQRLKNEAGQQMTMQNVGFAVAFQFDNQTAALAPALARAGQTLTCLVSGNPSRGLWAPSPGAAARWRALLKASTKASGPNGGDRKK